MVFGEKGAVYTGPERREERGMALKVLAWMDGV